MHKDYRTRRLVGLLLTLIIGWLLVNINNIGQSSVDMPTNPTPTTRKDGDRRLAIEALSDIEIKGRAPKTGYSRDQFGPGWGSKLGCDTRNIILNRDLINIQHDPDCNVLSGELLDPYTNQRISFVRGAQTSDEVQIDHVVALSDAWQKGAQHLSYERRVAFSNDPLNLLAVDGAANQQKSASDAASWLPPNRPFRCQYVARQIAVKLKYSLWVVSAEAEAMKRVLKTCPDQKLPQ